MSAILVSVGAVRDEQDGAAKSMLLEFATDNGPLAKVVKRRLWANKNPDDTFTWERGGSKAPEALAKFVGKEVPGVTIQTLDHGAKSIDGAKGPVTFSRSTVVAFAGEDETVLRRKYRLPSLEEAETIEPEVTFEEITSPAAAENSAA